ncbi:MAG: hypothetical protein HC942_07925, partial [Microcoleus sp. SU_5_6]|nr:hypothetical protein [Microcoleus sp. SU_5_6]
RWRQLPITDYQKRKKEEGRRKRGSFKLPFVNAFPVKTQNSKLKTPYQFPIPNLVARVLFN